MLTGLKNFLLRGNVVDLAVAVIIGAAFGAIVTAFASLLTGVIAALFGFEEVRFAIGIVDLGPLLTATINFLIVGIALFLVIKGIERAQRPGVEEDDVAAPDPQDIVLLREIRDLLVVRRT